MVDGANLVAFEQLRFDDIESLAFGRGQHERFVGRNSAVNVGADCEAASSGKVVIFR